MNFNMDLISQDLERHLEINDGLIEGEDLNNLNTIDEVISAEEEEFLSEQNRLEAEQEAIDQGANPNNIN